MEIPRADARHRYNPHAFDLRHAYRDGGSDAVDQRLDAAYPERPFAPGDRLHLRSVRDALRSEPSGSSCDDHAQRRMPGKVPRLVIEQLEHSGIRRTAGPLAKNLDRL